MWTSQLLVEIELQEEMYYTRSKKYLCILLIIHFELSDDKFWERIRTRIHYVGTSIKSTSE